MGIAGRLHANLGSVEGHVVRVHCRVGFFCAASHYRAVGFVLLYPEQGSEEVGEAAALWFTVTPRRQILLQFVVERH